MRITKIRIRGFKKFRSLDLDLDKFTILVGRNDSGKTTLLEAIHLTLTGQYRGKPLYKQLSQSMFNADNLKDYFNAIQTGADIKPPSITIEVFFDPEPRFQGNWNLDRTDASGIALKIAVEDGLTKQFSNAINVGTSELPIEFYQCKWSSFADEPLSLRQIPIKSSLLSSNSFADNESNILGWISDTLTDDQSLYLNGAYRKAVQEFLQDLRLQDINGSLHSSSDSQEIARYTSK